MEFFMQWAKFRRSAATGLILHCKPQTLFGLWQVTYQSICSHFRP